MSPVQGLHEALSGGATALLAVLLPLIGTLFIGAFRNRPNLREGATLATGAILFGVVLSLWPDIMAGGRPHITLSTPIPGIPLVLEVEPLGYLFSLVASSLWIV
ncbi:MAG: hypothetical protein MUO50_04085, partial [Longimicrobiales bacterium]|nr:hypothetical protein [Longimicrobiales bacterium]